MPILARKPFGQNIDEGIDTGEDELMNEILWFATKGNVPYPRFKHAQPRD